MSYPDDEEFYRQWWAQHNELANLLNGISSRSDTSNELLRGTQSDINRGFDRLDDGIFGLQQTLQAFLEEYKGDQKLKAELERQRFEFMLQWDSMTIEERKAFLRARDKRAKDEVRMAELRARKKEIRQAELTQFNKEFQARWLREESERNRKENTPERIAERKARSEQHAANFAKNQAKREARAARLLEEEERKNAFLLADSQLNFSRLILRIIDSRFSKILVTFLALIPWWFIAQQNFLVFLLFFLPVGGTIFGLYWVLKLVSEKLSERIEIRTRQMNVQYTQKKADRET